MFSKIPLYKINVVFLKTSAELISTNTLYIPISINKSQTGSGYLYIGKKLIIQINNKLLTGTYQQKTTDNTEYLLISSINDLDTVTFNFNDNGIYNEIEVINSENDVVTITDIKQKLIGTRNVNGYRGQSGLMTPTQYEAVDNIPFENNINSKYINELNTNSILFYYEKSLNENFTVTFQLKHSLFNVEYLIKTHGNNFQIKQNRFSSSLDINNLGIDLIVNKINNNLNTKTVYQIVAKLNNVPGPVLSNVEKVQIFINNPASENASYSVGLPTGYVLGNSQILIPTKTFNRNILYYDINGLVSVKDFEETQLTGLNNVNNIWVQGLYYYDIYNQNDVILNNLPVTKNVFYLQVKRLSSEIMIQYLYVLDTTKNEIKQYSRYRNSTTSVITVWIEYVTSSHKHLATDITTDPTHQFVTQTQINQWSSMTVSQFWKDAVMSKTDLPLTTNNGDTRLVLSENKIYRFNTINGQWILLNDVKIYRDITSDKVKIRVNEGGTDQIIELPFVAQNNPGIVPSEFYAEDYQNYFEQNLTFTPNNAGNENPTNYQRPMLATFKIIKDTDTDKKIYDGVLNIMVGNGVNPFVFDFSTGYTNVITKTLYTVMDNNNMFTGIVKEHNFIIKINSNGVKFIFPLSASVSLAYNNTITLLVGQEFLTDSVSTYYFNINVLTGQVLIIRETT